LIINNNLLFVKNIGELIFYITDGGQEAYSKQDIVLTSNNIQGTGKKWPYISAIF